MYIYLSIVELYSVLGPISYTSPLSALLFPDPQPGLILHDKPHPPKIPTSNLPISQVNLSTYLSRSKT
jgi:hypothetical protein